MTGTQDQVVSRYYPDEAKRFAADIKQHQMTVLHDDGLYRHIRFKKSGTYSYYFDLVTWPGCLTVRGDMGTFTFARIEDMVQFFLDGGDINPQYWAEKVQGAKGDVEPYSPDGFRARVDEAYENYVAEHPIERVSGLWNAIESTVLPHGYDEYEARRAVRDFEHSGFTFADAWEWDLFGYSYRYLWCCFAIRWGAQQYQAQKAGQVVSA